MSTMFNETPHENVGMTLVTLQEQFVKMLGVVSKLKAKDQTVLLEVNKEDGYFSATTYNENSTLRYTFSKLGTQSTSGHVIAPLNFLSSVVGILPPDRLDIQVNPSNDEIHLSCFNHEMMVKGLPSTDYDLNRYDISTLDIVTTFHVNTHDFIDYLSLFTPFASNDFGRILFTGVNFIIENGTIRLQTADGYRGSMGTFKIADKGKNANFTLPAQALKLYAAVVKSLGEIVPSTHETLIEIDSNNDCYIYYSPITHDVLKVSLIEGTFPDMSKLLPIGEPSAVITVFIKKLGEALSAMSAFTMDDAQLLVMEFGEFDGKGKLYLIRNPKQLSFLGGSSRVELDAIFAGKAGRIGLNCSYLTEVCRSLQGRYEQVTLHVFDPTRPIVIKNDNDNEFTHMIMPMHISN